MMRDFEAPGRSLAIATKEMAATSHPTATLVAVQTLQRGGNAMDAAVAAAAVQAVVEAGSTGIGGDCFVLLSKEGSTDVLAYNGSGRAPAGVRLNDYVEAGISRLGGTTAHAVTVPGAVEAWARLSADHGRLDLGEVLAPAVALAREGYAIAPRVAFDLEQNADKLAGNPAARAVFLPDGRVARAGEIHKQERLGDTLAAIGRHGPDAFYRGAVAEDMVACLQSLGGVHTLEDFACAAGEYVTPVTTEFHGRTVFECPPNGQGIIALLIMNILSRFDIGGGPLDIDNVCREVEATRLAYAARDALVADPAHGNDAVGYLLSDALADRLAAMIDPRRAAEDLPTFDDVEHRDTVYISVVDKDRNAVSFINSLFSGYGSGIVAPRSGVLFHNRGQSFSLIPGHPNAIAPGKRPMHTIIPGMAAQNGRATHTFGVMGGHYQAMGHADFLSKLFNFGLDMQSAIDLPRLFPLRASRRLECERRIVRDLGPQLVERGYELQPATRPIGGAQAIAIDWENGTLVGASDARKDGLALGY